jgi:hypothetical protein
VSAFDVLDRYGAGRLARFVGALVVFLLLHLARWPLMLAVRVVEAAMRRVDVYANGLADPLMTVGREPDHAHAP